MTNLASPFLEHVDDGRVSVGFNIPAPNESEARAASAAVVASLGLEDLHCDLVAQLDAATYHVRWAGVAAAVPYEARTARAKEGRTKAEIEASLVSLERPLVVVAGTLGTDTHTVGLDAVLSAKGYLGHRGLSAYEGISVVNLGRQIPVDRLISEAEERQADAILVSHTISHNGLHEKALREFIAAIHSRSLRQKYVLFCGGMDVTASLAAEVGFDAGFGRGSTPLEIADSLCRVSVARLKESSLQGLGHG